MGSDKIIQGIWCPDFRYLSFTEKLSKRVQLYIVRTAFFDPPPFSKRGKFDAWLRLYGFLKQKNQGKHNSKGKNFLKIKEEIQNSRKKPKTQRNK